MCGIAGIVASCEPVPQLHDDTIVRMLAMVRHRGPDEFGIYRDQRSALGNARLSIIDLATGSQPISNEDGTLWIVYNGETFNFVELRSELECRGHRFRTNTDTEVVLHLYEEYGAECLLRLNGEFAVAIWDSRHRTLFLARDRMGIRPLFYTERPGTLLFASEIKSLLAAGAPAEIDTEVLDQVFVYWSPLPGNTIFRGICEIPAGHYLTYKDGRISIQQYWDIPFPAPGDYCRLSEDDALDEFESLLTSATRIRLRSDVPVGAYLSGGLDSSVVASLVRAQTHADLATFSVTFDDRDFDESSYQMRVSKLLGTRHEVVNTSHADIARVFPEVVWHAETPLTRTAPAPMFLLSELVHACGFKVVLTGEGADEILAGYDIFKEAAIRRFWARRSQSTMRPLLLKRLYADIPQLAGTSPSILSAFFAKGLSDGASPYYSHAVRWRNNSRIRRFLARDLTICPEPPLPSQFLAWGHLQQAQYLESKIFLSQYLLSSQGDRMAMAHSVETRLPFLDYRVVEFCSRLPHDMKLRGLRDKYLLRRLGRKRLPPDISQRPKRPYRAPIHKSFFSQPVSDYVRELLSPRQIAAVGLFNPAAVSKLVDKTASGIALSETDEMALAGILSTQILHRQFVAKSHQPVPVSDHISGVALVCSKHLNCNKPHELQYPLTCN